MQLRKMQLRKKKIEKANLSHRESSMMMHEVCQMMLSDISKKQIATLAGEDSVQKAAQKMRDRNVGSIVVVNAQQHPVGIVTDRDIVVQVVAKSAGPSSQTVADIMSRDLLILSASDSLQEAARRMDGQWVWRGSVVDEQGALCGLIALDDVLILLSQCLSECAELIKKQAKCEGVETEGA